MSPNEGDKCAKYHSDVGYLPRKHAIAYTPFIDLILDCDRVKALKHFHSFTSMCVLRSW